jgi:formyltetrahydrofolate synthetase
VHHVIIPSRFARYGWRRGAGFIYPLAGDMRTMPGLPTHPGAERIDIDSDGNTIGLS